LRRLAVDWREKSSAAHADTGVIKDVFDTKTPGVEARLKKAQTLQGEATQAKGAYFHALGDDARRSITLLRRPDAAGWAAAVGHFRQELDARLGDFGGEIGRLQLEEQRVDASASPQKARLKEQIALEHKSLNDLLAQAAKESELLQHIENMKPAEGREILLDHLSHMAEIYDREADVAREQANWNTVYGSLLEYRRQETQAARDQEADAVAPRLAGTWVWHKSLRDRVSGIAGDHWEQPESIELVIRQLGERGITAEYTERHEKSTIKFTFQGQPILAGGDFDFKEGPDGKIAGTVTLTRHGAQLRVEWRAMIVTLGSDGWWRNTGSEELDRANP
jgi:hypothetical protein